MPTSDNIYSNSTVFKYNVSEEDRQEMQNLEDSEAELQAVPEEPVEAPKPEATQTPSPTPTEAPQAPTAPVEEAGAMAEPEEVEETKEQPTKQPGDTPFGNNQMLEDNLPENAKGALNMGMGAVDIVSDTIGLLPWLKPVDEWWEEVSGRNDPNYNPVQKMIRDTSSNLIPFLTAAGPLQAGLGKVGAAAKIPGAIDKTAKGAALLGLSTGISAVNDTTKEPGNLGTVLGDAFGIDVPWATRDGDSPDWIFAMNMMENVVIDGAGELVEILAGVRASKRVGNQIIPADEAAAARIKPQPPETPEQAMAKTRKLREDATAEEAVRRYEADPEGLKGYDDFVNEPAEPQKRLVQYKDADPVSFMADNDRILNNIDTTNGRQRPAYTEHFFKRFLRANDDVEIETIVEEAAIGLDINFNNVIGGATRTADEINESIDQLTAKVFMTEPQAFADQISELMIEGESILGNAVKTLPQDDFINLSNAVTKAVEIMAPGKRRARAVMSTQAGGGLVDVSRAIDLMGDTVDTARQQELAAQNLGVLMKAVREQQYIDGFRLNLKKLVKDNPQQITAEWMGQQNEAFKVNLKNNGAKTLEFIDTLTQISRTKPEYFKPLYKQFVKTGGKIDDLYKLGKLIDNRMGFWKKAFLDGEPEVPSLLVKELDGVRYNNVLNGLAPINAGAGAILGLTAKPLTILTGNLANFKFAEFAEDLKVFGGVVENFQRGLKYASSEWKYANENPDFSAIRGRQDFQLSSMEDFDMLEELSDTWYKEGDFGKVAGWNVLKVSSMFNRQNWNRWGINSMTAIDGFVKSMNASMIARSRAMQEVFTENNGAWNEVLFQQKQRKLYNNSFDAEGVLTDEAAKYAAGEINLNLDNGVVTRLNGMIETAPITKAVFLFPRTGLNAQILVGTFSPTGVLGQSIGKARKAQKAALNSPQAAEVLMEHGFAPDDMRALTRLQSEYKGRALMGSSLVMGAAFVAINGNLTGSGPSNDAMKRDMRAKGWKPYHINIGGEMRSYQNMGPITTFLGLTADVVYESQRADQAITEDWFRTLAHSISMNVTSQTFLSGFEPLAAAIAGDQGAWARLSATMTDSYIPATGIRGALSRTLVSQLKDVENSWQAHLANRNRFIPPVNSALVDAQDIYTGKLINYHEPMTALMNTILPFGKTNGGMEPWRQKFIESGWTGMKQNRMNPDTKEPFTPEQRRAMNTWIAENEPLGEAVETIFNHPDQWWKKNLKDFVKAKGLKPKNIMDVKDTYLYQLLDDVHDVAYANAYKALKAQDESITQRGNLRKATAEANKRGDFNQASDLAEKFLQKTLK